MMSLSRCLALANFSSARRLASAFLERLMAALLYVADEAAAPGGILARECSTCVTGQPLFKLTQPCSSSSFWLLRHQRGGRVPKRRDTSSRSSPSPRQRKIG